MKYKPTLQTCLVNYAYSIDHDLIVPYVHQENDIALDVFGNVIDSSIDKTHFIIRNLQDKDIIEVYYIKKDKAYGGNCSNYLKVSQLIKTVKAKLGL